MGVILQSYAAKHREDVEAGRVASPTHHHRANHGGNRHLLMLAKLESDKYELGTIRSQKQRIERKLDLLGEYADYLTTVINGGNRSHNETLVNICLWALDTWQHDYFMTLAEFALQSGMKAPKGFKRSLPELLLEEFSLVVMNKAQPQYDINRLMLLGELTQGANITDEVTAKFHKARGLALQTSDPQAALLAYQTAQSYGGKVKPHIKRLEKILCKPTNPTD